MCFIFFYDNLSVFRFIALNAVADQNQNLTVGGAAFIIGDDVQFVQHMKERVRKMKVAVVGSRGITVEGLEGYSYRMTSIFSISLAKSGILRYTIHGE